MKTLLNLLFVCIAGFALTACETTGLGHHDDAPPYADERTATHEQTAAATPEPAPAAEPCVLSEKGDCKGGCDKHKSDCGGDCSHCGGKDARIAALEAELAACREASNRVRDAYTDELKK
jgi:hypothetical protein